MQNLPVIRGALDQKNAARLPEMNVETFGQWQDYDLTTFTKKFGSFGAALYKLCRGIDNRIVQPNRIRKRS